MLLLVYVAWFSLFCWPVSILAATQTKTTASTYTNDIYNILEAPRITRSPDCPSKCGNLRVPYPFGVGEGTGCSIEPGFDIICKNSKPFTGNIEVYDISDNHLRVATTVSKKCYNSSGGTRTTSLETDLEDSPYSFSDANSFFLISCNDVGYIGTDAQWTSYTGCVSYCSGIEDVIPGSCTGLGCCQVPTPKLQKYYTNSLSTPNENITAPSFNCSYGFLGEHDRFTFRGAEDLQDPEFEKRTRASVPIVLDWAIGHLSCQQARKSKDYACKGKSSCVDSDRSFGGYRCECFPGYKGNPYLDPGCTDINECEDPNISNCERCTNLPGNFSCSCPPGYSGDGTKGSCTREFPVIKFSLGVGFGILALLIVARWLYFANKKRKLIQLREKFFLQNGGLLLKQQVNSNGGGVEATRLFIAEELEKATNNYAKDKILGQGGYGIVYKGILLDKCEVAIKKSRIMNKSQIEQFINEVIILAQVDHRNVVKLLGCCLEAAEVPLLVYEYVSNGTLFHHIHDSGTSWLSWENRLRIATKASSALAYLHSTASKPIIHRDVKSANILLDDNYTARISDFGASRLVSLDQTQVATLVQGTLGYLDPKYFHNSQLTPKSDVYSFGVVLAELLTGKKPLCTYRSQEERNLAIYLVTSMKENRLFQILDPQIVREGSFEQIQSVAELTKKCINLTGENRPTMKEVTMELEGIRKLNNQPWTQAQGSEEVMRLLAEKHATNFYGTGVEVRDLYTIELGSSSNASHVSGQYSLELDSIPMLFPSNGTR